MIGKIKGTDKERERGRDEKEVLTFRVLFIYLTDTMLAHYIHISHPNQLPKFSVELTTSNCSTTNCLLVVLPYNTYHSIMVHPTAHATIQWYKPSPQHNTIVNIQFKNIGA